MIRKEDGEWILYDRAGTKVLGRHVSFGSAYRQEKAIQAAKSRRKVSSIQDLYLLSKQAKKEKPNPELVAEDAKIEKNKKTPEARKPHKFRKAKWTHPNGHPRCLLCGGEQRTDNNCPGRAAMEKMSASKMYHGSPAKLSILKPAKQPGQSGKPPAVYGTPRRGLALFFSIPGAKWKNLTREKGKWVVRGLTEKQLDGPGRLYHLNPKGFRKYEGWQHISDKAIKPTKIEVVPNVGQALKRHGFKIEKTSAVRKKYKPFPHQAVAIKQLLDNDGVMVFAHGTGTGKTYSAIVGTEALRYAGKAKRALVVAPTGLRKNFVNNIEKFTNSSYQIVGNKAEREFGYKYLPEVKADKDYTVVGYAMFRRDPVGLMQRSGADTLIMDEYHKARDPHGKTFKAAMAARRGARNFLGLTASIVNNDPREVAPLVALARAGKFITPRQFDRLYKRQVGVTPGFFGGRKKQYALVNVRDLQQRIGPVLSYLDTEDLRPEDLPRRDVKTVDIEMSPHQKALYQFAMKKLPASAVDKIRNNLPMNQREAFHIFGMIQQARQASNSIAALDRNVPLEESAERTPKIKHVLDDAMAHLKSTPDGKVVMYTNLVRGGVDVLHAGLNARGIPHGVFIGKGRKINGVEVTDESRNQAVEDFKAGKTKVIVLSGAGAEGLDLKNATMFQALDGHFNPERILQAEARARRLKGQKHRPPEKRVVEVRRYRSILPAPGFWSSLFGGSKKEFATDEWVYNVAQRKHALNKMLRNAVRAVSLAKPQGAPPKIELPYAPEVQKEPVKAPGRPVRPARQPIQPVLGVGGPSARSPITAQSPKVKKTEPVKLPRQTRYIRRWKDPRTGRWRYEYPKVASVGDLLKSSAVLSNYQKSLDPTPYSVAMPDKTFSGDSNPLAVYRKDPPPTVTQFKSKPTKKRRPAQIEDRTSVVGLFRRVPSPEATEGLVDASTEQTMPSRFSGAQRL